MHGLRVAQLVSELLDLIRSDIVLIIKNMVVSWPTSSLKIIQQFNSFFCGYDSFHVPGFQSGNKGRSQMQ